MDDDDVTKREDDDPAHWSEFFANWTHAVGREYAGERNNGKYHGQGTLIITDTADDEYIDSCCYVGEFQDGLYHGMGTLTETMSEVSFYHIVNRYVGEFENGKYHGQGTFNSSTSDFPEDPMGSLSKYVGQFKEGRKHGHGTYTHANGDKYVGEWKDGKKHGQGTYTYANGDKYVGGWKGGEQEGTLKKVLLDKSSAKNTGTPSDPPEKAESGVDKKLLTSIANSPITLITGGAGTGKSRLISELLGELEGTVVVVAFTGVAALQVRGETIHSFFKLPVTVLSDDKTGDSKLKDKFKAVDYLIIDEVSMLRADVLDAIFRTFELYGKNPGVPLGGVKVILVGDFLQLEPILDQDEDAKRYFYKRYQTSYFFEATGLQKYKVFIKVLTKNFRQLDDQLFIGVLSNVRTGDPTQQHLIELGGRVTDWDSHSVLLSSTNERVDYINQRSLEKIGAPESVYRPYITGNFEELSYPTSAELRLKVGALVMFTRNDSERERRWANGTLAHVVDLNTDSVAVKTLETGRSLIVKRSIWENYTYFYSQETDSLAVTVSGTFEHFPLALAWAKTIHKSQGQTIDGPVHIDLPSDYNAMPSQLYVALSRARSLESISLSREVGLTDCSVNRRAKEAWIFALENSDTLVDFRLSKMSGPTLSKDTVTKQRSAISLSLGDLVNDAMDSKARLNMDYVSGTGRKWRIVRPLEWDVLGQKFTAYCEDNEENRSFRVDRIQDAMML